jgi:deoxyribodipyrimidine photo-lyase
LEIDCSVQPVSWLVSGSKAGLQRLSEFLDKTLAHYENTRNDPNAKGLSHLSPYLHFGQIAPQRVALETMQVTEEIGEQKRAFLEELVVRRELADNFCFYNALYDSFEGLPRWAKESLDKHKKVPRDPLYSYEDFEFSRTHDPLWNAAQTQMRHSGKMHGYLRMYWAKKVLEWTVSPEEAIAWAIQLNDTYELDGRDPNGYTGVLWSIGGLHDRPFKERPIFGKVRYMSYKGCQRKFDVNLFIAQWGSEQQ